MFNLKKIGVEQALEKLGMYQGNKQLILHHIYPHTTEDAIDHFKFMLDNPVTPVSYPKVSLEDSLTYILNKIKEAGLDAIYVDITPEFFRQFGIHSVRAIIPGAVGVYATKDFRPLGSKRLYEVPKKLGYKTPRRFNPYPHPLP